MNYLPNENILITKFQNEDAELIMSGPNNSNKLMVTEFFRGITLCH